MRVTRGLIEATVDAFGKAGELMIAKQGTLG